VSIQELLKGILVLAVLAAGSALLFLFRHEPESTVVLSRAPGLVENRPIGEIVPGFRAEHRVTDRLAANRNSLPGNAAVCVEILLANFSNRQNTGYFDIGLGLDDREFFRQVEASSVADNAKRRVCFDDVTVRSLLAARELRILLRGVSSPPGAAVTAWTTTDVSSGQMVAVPGSAPPRSLVAGLSAQDGDQTGSRNALVLIAFGALSIATLLMARRRDRLG
jgi:hypothetical protein